MLKCGTGVWISTVPVRNLVDAREDVVHYAFQHRRYIEPVKRPVITFNTTATHPAEAIRMGSRDAVVLFGEVRFFQNTHPWQDTDKKAVALVRQKVAE